MVVLAAIWTTVFSALSCVYSLRWPNLFVSCSVLIANQKFNWSDPHDKIENCLILTSISYFSSKHVTKVSDYLIQYRAV